MTGGRTGGQTPKVGYIDNGGLARVVALTLSIAVSLSGGHGVAQSSKPFINVPNVVLAEPAIETPLPIQIGPTDGIPYQAFLRIRGLPGTAALTEGHAIAAGAWAIPISGLSRLKIIAPVGASGKSDITVSLVAIDGNVLSEVRATLLVAPAALIASAGRDVNPGPQAANTASLGPSPVPVPRSQPEARPAPAPSVPAPPQLRPEDRESALKHMQRGDENMIAGNITVARLFYQRAADLGWGQGALSLAATYDPNELGKWTVLGGVQPDRALALQWYEKARELGTSEAVERMQRLGSR